jgi:hypothetical protein
MDASIGQNGVNPTKGGPCGVEQAVDVLPAGHVALLKHDPSGVIRNPRMISVVQRQLTPSVLWPALRLLRHSSLQSPGWRHDLLLSISTLDDWKLPVSSLTMGKQDCRLPYACRCADDQDCLSPEGFQFRVEDAV